MGAEEGLPLASPGETPSAAQEALLAQVRATAAQTARDTVLGMAQELAAHLAPQLAQEMVARLTPRVGIGFDAHRLVEGRRLVLGGVEIEHSHGLLGHSDADAVAHAVIEAVLGAAGAGNIGQLFPDKDPAFKDADSLRLLAVARQRIESKGLRIASVDVSILAEKPRLMPHAPQMRQNLAAVLGLEPDAVSLKATTCEGMGALGRQEGMAALAVATLLPQTV